MSNWVHLEISVNKNSTVSVKKVVNTVWKGASVSKEDLSYNKRTIFYVGYPDCGKNMLTDIKKILEDIKSYDNKSNPQILITNCLIY